MNPVIDAIRSRRTVKKMDPERAPAPSDVEAVIEAGTWAPNHHATEPWRFVVVTGEARRRLGVAIAAALAASSTEQVAPERLESEKNKPLSSPVIVALIGAPKKGDNVVPQEEIVAAGAALQNMLLAAHSLGLASFVRTGAHSYSGEVRAFFGMGEDETLIGMVYLGYASGAIPPGKRTPFREKVSWMRD
ncbi:MAG: nitroreductase [Thaumarchaeota archaeon]|nr:nitroreductase [Nitrososphaerota archaeon]